MNNKKNIMYFSLSFYRALLRGQLVSTDDPLQTIVVDSNGNCVTREESSESGEDTTEDTTEDHFAYEYEIDDDDDDEDESSNSSDEDSDISVSFKLNKIFVTKINTTVLINFISDFRSKIQKTYP